MIEQPCQVDCRPASFKMGDGASAPVQFHAPHPPCPSLDPQRLDAFFEDVHLIAESLARIADRLDPKPGDIVGTPYIAEKLGCTTAWITGLIKQGEIPAHSIVDGTGHGKPWKFHRRAIDAWIKARGSGGPAAS